ncbi:MAG: DNA gyrase subunit A [Phototrophicales bacterium]|nr:MAG: DNA gyrase subunit A [Phototrophicales bacterium]
MADNTENNDELNGNLQNSGFIRSMDINEEMRGSYLDYAMSVIVSRALPDARDGLKPVQRRILFAMYDMGLRPGTPYKKSARIVGEVLGKYHPHGDGAVYDAMSRMAQDFSLRYMLVDGQGNFGSVDGDSPAAMRYTEARMAPIANELLVDIEMNTVDFQDNYDGSQQEPIVLPARLPNLLLNGATGIAVGMATSIPPHNLRELTSAIAFLIDNYDRIDDITLDDLMQYVKCPDFPTGAMVVINDELKEAYATGKGRVFIRATHTIEEHNGYQRIVFTSIPYQVSKAAIIERIVSLVREGRLDSVRDLRDESDRQGMRLVIELKRGVVAQTALNQLLKYTQLQSTFGIQMLALVNGEPRTLSLKRCLQIYIEHRYEVIQRRSQFELDKRRARAHILEGLLKAISQLDAIIRTIRAADDADMARTNLMNNFELSQAQAEAILEMQLRRLAALERQKLQTEYDEVLARIAYLEDLLRSPDKIRALIRADVMDIADKFGDDRKTQITYGATDFDESELVREEDVVVSLTTNGYIKRVPAREYRAQRRGGKGVIGMQTKEEDGLYEIFFASSLDDLLLFSDKGKVYSQKVYRIPETGRANRGTLIHSILPLSQDEHITAILPVESFEKDGGFFTMVTRHGRIKRVHMQEFADVRNSGIIAITLNEDDYLGWVKYTDGNQDVVIVTQQGQSIRFHETETRPLGRMAAGVNAIRLSDGDVVAGMDVIGAEHTHILVVTANGYGKRTTIDKYLQQARFGSGVRTIARSEKTGDVVCMRCIKEEDEIMVITRNGVVLRTALSAIRETGRSTQGVILIDVAEGDAVASIAIMKQEPEKTPEEMQ